MRYELTDFEWTAIRPLLANKPRGVPRVNGLGVDVSVADVETLHRVLREVRAVAELDTSAPVGRRPQKGQDSFRKRLRVESSPEVTLDPVPRTAAANEDARTERRNCTNERRLT